MPGCPHTTADGCRCPEHAPGLAAYARNPAAYEAALVPLRGPVRLSVVTLGPQGVADEPPCTGRYTCPCRTCQAERATPARRGNASPFKVRRAA